LGNYNNKIAPNDQANWADKPALSTVIQGVQAFQWQTVDQTAGTQVDPKNILKAYKDKCHNFLSFTFLSVSVRFCNYITCCVVVSALCADIKNLLKSAVAVLILYKNKQFVLSYFLHSVWMLL
jgi:hypothetical protein